MPYTPARKRKKSRSKKRKSGLILAGGLVLACVLTAVGSLGLRQETPPPTDPPATEPLVTEATVPANVYSAEDFSYEQGYLTCSAGPAVLGIDVSSHQKQIDWEQVSQSEMKFAFVRLGYRGYTEGVLHADDYYEANLDGAKAAGLQVGAYFFSQAISTEEAAQEAALCIELLENRQLELPVVYDWEYVSQQARTANMDADTLTQCALTFCRAIEKAGYEAMIYANPDIAGRLYHRTELQEYRFWLAMYTDAMTYPYKMDFWQYTDAGQVPGIEGNVDINLMFLYD